MAFQVAKHAQNDVLTHTSYMGHKTNNIRKFGWSFIRNHLGVQGMCVCVLNNVRLSKMKDL